MSTRLNFPLEQKRFLGLQLILQINQTQKVLQNKFKWELILGSVYAKWVFPNETTV